jgi:hypothetical protein
MIVCSMLMYVHMCSVEKGTWHSSASAFGMDMCLLIYQNMRSAQKETTAVRALLA